MIYRPAFGIERIHGGRAFDVLTGEFEPSPDVVVEMRALVRADGTVLSVGGTEPFVEGWAP